MVKAAGHFDGERTRRRQAQHTPAREAAACPQIGQAGSASARARPVPRLEWPAKPSRDHRRQHGGRIPSLARPACATAPNGPRADQPARFLPWPGQSGARRCSRRPSPPSTWARAPRIDVLTCSRLPVLEAVRARRSAGHQLERAEKKFRLADMTAVSDGHAVRHHAGVGCATGSRRAPPCAESHEEWQSRDLGHRGRSASSPRCLADNRGFLSEIA